MKWCVTRDDHILYEGSLTDCCYWLEGMYPEPGWTLEALADLGYRIVSPFLCGDELVSLAAVGVTPMMNPIRPALMSEWRQREAIRLLHKTLPRIPDSLYDTFALILDLLEGDNDENR